MQAASKAKISELQAIITKMTLEICYVAAVPEFGVRWHDVARAVRNARLPMTPASVAKVLCRHVVKSLPADEVADIIAVLRLKLVASQPRTWHLLRLEGRQASVPPGSAMLPRIRAALQASRLRRARPEVHIAKLGDLIYISLRLVSSTKEGTVLYLAVPPRQDVMLTTSLAGSALLKVAVQALGYEEYVNTNLHGHDIPSLLRINDRNCNENVDYLAQLPEYAPTPIVTKNGIDYTNKTYDEQYVETLIGPDPPLLTDLKITTTKIFFDPSKLNKLINLTVQLKSDDIAKSLKAWVSRGALSPTSDFFQIYQNLKSNKVTYSREDSD